MRESSILRLQTVTDIVNGHSKLFGHVMGIFAHLLDGFHFENCCDGMEAKGIRSL